MRRLRVKDEYNGLSYYSRFIVGISDIKKFKVLKRYFEMGDISMSAKGLELYIRDLLSKIENPEFMELELH